MEKNNQFKDIYRDLIRDYIRKVRQDGTIAMSTENLFMCVRVHNNTPGAPVGTNCRYYLRQAFMEIVDENNDIKKFIY